MKLNNLIPQHHHTLYGIVTDAGTRPASTCWWQWFGRVFRVSMIEGDV